MWTRGSGRGSPRFLGRRSCICRRRWPEQGSSRDALRPRWHGKLGGDIAPLLGQPAEAIGISPNLVDMQIALVVQGPEQRAHLLENGGDIGCLFVLGIGALGDVDIEPETRQFLFRERP